MLDQNIAPFPVTQPRQVLAGGNNVREQNSRENPFGTYRLVMLSGQELLNRARDILQMLGLKER